MPFELRNQEWRKRKVNKGGRPTREEMEKKRAVQRETQRAVKFGADAAQVLTVKDLEFGSKVLVAGGVHIGDVIGDDIDIGLLRQHAGRRDAQGFHELFPLDI